MDRAEQRAAVAMWRHAGLKRSSAQVYLRWIERFRIYCRAIGKDETQELTAARVRRFARSYARTHHIREQTAFHSAHSALRAWAVVLERAGQSLPPWCSPATPRQPSSPIVQAFGEHLRVNRGNPQRTIHKKLVQISQLLRYLHRRRRRIEDLQLVDIDRFVLKCAQRYARTTTADICSTIRTFLRFLHATGRVPLDYSPSVAAPCVRRNERPHRALAWDQVRRILRAVDRSTPMGRRDYAMLLMMSSYGFGAAEVIGLTLDDVNWRAATLRVVRPKTGVVFHLPLLPAIARALVDYLKHGRPQRTPTRDLFVSTHVPYQSLSCASSVRYILAKHARLAGVCAPYLGAHVLRHSHARRQLERGTNPKLIGDILGHRRAESTSAYIRIATQQLRSLALPVPR